MNAGGRDGALLSAAVVESMSKSATVMGERILGERGALTHFFPVLVKGFDGVLNFLGDRGRHATPKSRFQTRELTRSAALWLVGLRILRPGVLAG